MALPFSGSLISAHMCILTRSCIFFPTFMWMAEVELGRKYKGTHLHHICCKMKDWIHRDNTYIYYLIRLVQKMEVDTAPFLTNSVSPLSSFLFFLRVMLLWHAIVSLSLSLSLFGSCFFHMKRYQQSIILEHLLCETWKYLCIKTEPQK